MGNLCGKPSKDSNNFEGPGRVLGSAPSQPATATKASIPARVSASAAQPSQSSPSSPPKVGGPARTLGTSNTAAGDAKSAAAAAAEVRDLHENGVGVWYMVALLTVEEGARKQNPHRRSRKEARSAEAPDAYADAAIRGGGERGAEASGRGDGDAELQLSMCIRDTCTRVI
jgi:hypothetical protein